MTAEQNLQLLAAMDSHRRFILQAYLDNPQLLATADARLRSLIDWIQTIQREVALPHFKNNSELQ